MSLLPKRCHQISHKPANQCEIVQYTQNRIHTMCAGKSHQFAAAPAKQNASQSDSAMNTTRSRTRPVLTDVGSIIQRLEHLRPKGIRRKRGDVRTLYVMVQSVVFIMKEMVASLLPLHKTRLWAEVTYILRGCTRGGSELAHSCFACFSRPSLIIRPTCDGALFQPGMIADGQTVHYFLPTVARKQIVIQSNATRAWFGHCLLPNDDTQLVSPSHFPEASISQPSKYFSLVDPVNLPHTPGHSPTLQCYSVSENGSLFLIQGKFLHHDNVYMNLPWETRLHTLTSNTRHSLLHPCIVTTSLLLNTPCANFNFNLVLKRLH